MFAEASKEDKEFFLGLVDWAVGIESARGRVVGEAAERNYGAVGAIKAKTTAKGCIRFVAMNSLAGWALFDDSHDEDYYSAIIAAIGPGEA